MHLRTGQLKNGKLPFFSSTDYITRQPAKFVEETCIGRGGHGGASRPPGPYPPRSGRRPKGCGPAAATCQAEPFPEITRPKAAGAPGEAEAAAERRPSAAARPWDARQASRELGSAPCAGPKTVWVKRKDGFGRHGGVRVEAERDLRGTKGKTPGVFRRKRVFSPYMKALRACSVMVHLHLNRPSRPLRPAMPAAPDGGHLPESFSMKSDRITSKLSLISKGRT